MPRVNHRVRRRRYAETPWLIHQNDWYELDAVTDTIWRACERASSVEMVVKTVADEHALPLGEALAATVAILERFRALGFVDLPGVSRSDD